MLDLETYRNTFGADYFGFWFGAIRILVLNSTLLCYPSVSVSFAPAPFISSLIACVHSWLLMRTLDRTVGLRKN